MKDRELKKLRRSELLELLLDQMQLNQKLQEELNEVKKELDDCEMRREKAQEMAETVLALRPILERLSHAGEDNPSALQKKIAVSVLGKETKNSME